MLDLEFWTRWILFKTPRDTISGIIALHTVNDRCNPSIPNYVSHIWCPYSVTVIELISYFLRNNTDSIPKEAEYSRCWRSQGKGPNRGNRYCFMCNLCCTFHGTKGSQKIKKKTKIPRVTDKGWNFQLEMSSPVEKRNKRRKLLYPHPKVYFI